MIHPCDRRTDGRTGDSIYSIAYMLSRVKTKEMLIGPLAKNPPPPLSLNGTLVDRVSSFKLLGVHISTDLKWKEHVQVIASKAASRLHFLKQLKRAGAPNRDLLHILQ